MKFFRLNLDEITEEIFYELENLSQGRESHYCDIYGLNKEHAAEILTRSLRPFFAEKLKPYVTERDNRV